MFGLTVHTNTNGQLDSALGCSFEQREQTVSSWMFGFIWVLIEISNLFLVHSNRQNLFFLEFVRMVFVSFDNHESVIFVQSDFRGHQKNFGKEVLFLQQFFVIWLLDLSTFISHRTYNNLKASAEPFLQNNSPPLSSQINSQNKVKLSGELKYFVTSFYKFIVMRTSSNLNDLMMSLAGKTDSKLGFTTTVK